MDRLTSIEMFLDVAREGTFSGVAKAHRVSKSAVSKHVAALEQHLGVRLLNRTTRKVSLTEHGRAYRTAATKILAELREAELALSSAASEPRGLLRVAAPISFGISVLGRLLPKFLAEYPDVDLDLALDDRFVDIVRGGFDVTIRIARPSDSGLVIRKLGTSETVVCASPAYLDTHGWPRRPEDLSAHQCLMYSGLEDRGWPFQRGDRLENIRVQGRFVADNGDVLRQAALAGLGIVHLPMFIIGDDLQAGRLRTVLDSYQAPDYPIYALFPHRTMLPTKVRCFLEYLSEALGSTEFDDVRSAPSRRTRTNASRDDE